MFAALKICVLVMLEHGSWKDQPINLLPRLKTRTLIKEKPSRLAKVYLRNQVLFEYAFNEFKDFSKGESTAITIERFFSICNVEFSIAAMEFVIFDHLWSIICILFNTPTHSESWFLPLRSLTSNKRIKTETYFFYSRFVRILNQQLL